jgi:selenocysteine lyase/cysteine desulfurase
MLAFSVPPGYRRRRPSRSRSKIRFEVCRCFPRPALILRQDTVDDPGERVELRTRRWPGDEEYPWRLEAGTLNLPGIAGLAAGVRFVRSVGVNAIADHEANLARVLADELRKIDGLKVYCEPAPRTGVVSFRLDGADVALTGTILDESFGIAVRTGLHCAPAAHQAIGTFPEGTVRVSFGQFNTRTDVDALVASLRQIKTMHAADRSVGA